MVYNVGVVSLGCASNLVDSEIMLSLLEKGNYKIVEDLSWADIIIVNTYGFIEAAKEESINTILELAKYKKDGCLKVLIASGCLSERYNEELMKEIPELDATIGTGDYIDILSVIERTLSGQKVCAYGNVNLPFDETLSRKVTTPKHTAYVIIGEGCNNHCTYCIIPTLRGTFRSRKIEDIKREVTEFVDRGVKEVILIAQDVTQYGIDIYGEHSLSQLLKELDKIDKLKWIRLLYVYPENIDDQLIQIIKDSKKVLHYLDIPFQHTESNILKLMARKTTKEKIHGLVKKLRKNIPHLVIRSTFITGFPGETDEDFNNMVDSIKELKLDRVGVFTYSPEENTKASEFKNQVPEDIKESRQQKILEIQQEISLLKNRSRISQILDVLIEGVTDDSSVYFGRSYMDAPEVDGVVYVHTNTGLEIGTVHKVLINDALEYDLIGEII